MHDTHAGRGRPVSACLTDPDRTPGIDKWAVLGDLTRAADAYGLGHRTLSVLKALLTFLPDRVIPATGRAVVFPSNRTLSDRLSGMPESTLRRHLAALVAAGIVSRQDSPNRKRFARGGAGGIAFGFDLAPLAQQARAIHAAAEAARARAERIAVLRARIAVMRQQLLTRTGDTEADDTLRKHLRRKLTEAELTAIARRLTTLLPNEPSATDSQNERHIQDTEKKVSVSHSPGPRCTDPDIRPEDVARACPEARSFFPGQTGTWRDLIAVSEQMAPMIGIEGPVLRDAQNVMGPQSAAATVFCMVERLSAIRNPGAYLRRLTQTAAQGRYDAAKAVKSLKTGTNARKLSADNSNSLCMSGTY